MGFPAYAFSDVLAAPRGRRRTVRNGDLISIALPRTLGRPGFVALVVWKAPPLTVVLACALASIAIA